MWWRECQRMAASFTGTALDALTVTANCKWETMLSAKGREEKKGNSSVLHTTDSCSYHILRWSTTLGLGSKLKKEPQINHQVLLIKMKRWVSFNKRQNAHLMVYMYSPCRLQKYPYVKRMRMKFLMELKRLLAWTKNRSQRNLKKSPSFWRRHLQSLPNLLSLQRSPSLQRSRNQVGLESDHHLTQKQWNQSLQVCLFHYCERYYCTIFL